MSSTSRHGRNTTRRSTTGRHETSQRQATTTRRRNPHPIYNIIRRANEARALRDYPNFLQRQGGSRKKLNKRRKRKA